VPTLGGRHPRSVTNLAESYQSLANRPQPPPIPIASSRSYDSPWSSNAGSSTGHGGSPNATYGLPNGPTNGPTNNMINGVKPINDSPPVTFPTRKASVRKAAPTWQPSPTSPDAEKLQALQVITGPPSTSTSRSASPVRRPQTAPSSPVITTTFGDKTTHVHPPGCSSTGCQTEGPEIPKYPGPRPIVAHPDLADVAELRSLLARSTSPTESRLLVDMYFAKWGFSAASENEESHSSDPPAPPLVQDDGSTDDHLNDGFMVEMLLGEGASIPIIKDSDPSVPQTPTNPEPTENDIASPDLKTETQQLVVSPDDSP